MTSPLKNNTNKNTSCEKQEQTRGATLSLGKENTVVGIDDETDPTRIVPMRLQKFLARAGAASRRGSENLMTAGRVAVNGSVVTELGSKVDPRIDTVTVDGKPVFLSDVPVTLMLNKPAGVVTTMSDPHARRCVAELVPTAEYPGLYPIGRLDTDSTGLLLFSTDGELGHALLHPRHQVEKRYEALVEGRPDDAALKALREGIELEDGVTLPARVERIGGRKDNTQTAIAVTIHEGRKRQVRRMFDAIGHPVMSLNRTQFGPLSLGDLPRGQWRVLEAGEVASLHAATHA